MKTFSVLWIGIAIWAFSSIGYAAMQKQFVYELQVKYSGKGQMTISTSGYFNIDIEIDSQERGESLIIRNIRGTKGITQPYTINVYAPSNKFALVNVNLGNISFGTLNIDCHDIGTIRTHSCELNLKSDTQKRINYVYARPGIKSFIAPQAKVTFLSAFEYIGDPEFAVSVSNEFPRISISALKFGTIRMRKLKKYRYDNWISQVAAQKIGKVIGSAVSHIFSENHIKFIKTYNVSGLIMSGTIFSNQTVYYQKGNVKIIRAGAIFDCYILAGVPPLLIDNGVYYDVIPANGKVKSIRAESTQNTQIVSARRVRFGWLSDRPTFGTETIVWENQKARKLKLHNIKKKN